MKYKTMKTGKIIAIVNCGTRYRVLVQEEASSIFPVNFDHRLFSWMREAEGNDLIGREIEYDDLNNSIRFLAVIG